MSGIVVRIIDTRLGRAFKTAGPHDYTCDSKTAMTDLFARIKKDCGSRKIASLQILSHAYYEAETTPKWADTPTGLIKRFGFGVQFCAEGIHDDTAANFQAFRGMFSSRERGIELRGCGPAASSVAMKSVGHLVFFKIGDGQALCQKIADAAGTGVVASSDEQPGPCDVEIRTYKTRVNGLPATVEDVIPIACEAGPWSGNVWLFKPNGTAATPVPH